MRVSWIFLIVGLAACAGTQPGRPPRSLVVREGEGQVSLGRTQLRTRGYLDGRLAAEQLGVRGRFVRSFMGAAALVFAGSDRIFFSGVGGGVFAGLAGTGIFWALTEGDQVPEALMEQRRNWGPDYTAAFSDGYRERTRQRKRSVVLRGGLSGTVAGLAGVLFVVEDR